MSDRRLGAQRTFAKVPISKYKCMETQVQIEKFEKNAKKKSC